MPEIPESISVKTPWEGDKNTIWLSSSLILLRNLNRYNFPPKQKEPEGKSSLSLVQQALLGSSSLKTPLFLPADQTSALDKELLYEHYLCHDSFQNATASQGFVVDQSGEFLAILNFENHIQLQIIDKNGEIEGAWNRLSVLESELAKNLELAYSPKFGYLTADASQCGTGLLVFAYLHLPALSHTKQLQEVLQKQLEEEVHAMGLEGAMDDLVGDIVVLRNPFTLGLNEESILHSLQNSALKLMAAEKTLRSGLKEKGSSELKDQVGRAFGLLVHSYQLQTKEAMNSLSLLKLGADLGWIEGISQGRLSELFFQCRRAHLSRSLGEKAVDSQEIPRKRAEFIQKALEGVKVKE